jgi:hypothetical protein
MTASAIAAGFPPTALDWLIYIYALDIPPEKLWRSMLKDVDPIPPGQAGVLLAVYEREGKDPVTLLRLKNRLRRKISMHTIDAMVAKGWLVRAAPERGAGWILKRAFLPTAAAIHSRLETRRARVMQKLNA